MQETEKSGSGNKAGPGKENKGGGAGGAGNEATEARDLLMVPAPLPISEESEKKEPGSAKVKKDKPVAAVTERIGQVFDLTSIYLGDHWKLQPREAESIAGPLVDCSEMIHPKAKEIIGQWSPPLSLIAAAAIVVVPRLMTTVAMQKGKANEFTVDPGEPTAKPGATDEGKAQADNERRVDPNPSLGPSDPFIVGANPDALS